MSRVQYMGKDKNISEVDRNVWSRCRDVGPNRHLREMHDLHEPSIRSIRQCHHGSLSSRLNPSALSDVA